MKALTLFLVCLSSVAPALAQEPEEEGRQEATSLLGTPLLRPPLSEEFRKEQEALLAEAQAALQANPEDAEAHLWVGRRTAYLGRYGRAIKIFSRGIEAHPEDPRFLRHRGHRYITIRNFAAAVADLSRAAEMIKGKKDRVEPDGLPNERNLPRSTLQFNIWYHLGLGHYLQGDFDAALKAYRRCLEVSTNPDMLVATSHWLYMTLRRLEKPVEAAKVLEPIEPGMDLVENRDYHRLLMMYKGNLQAEQVLNAVRVERADIGYPTTAYGVGNWHLYNGQKGKAREVFQNIVDSADSWAAFGHIAAEAELAR